MKMQNNKGVTLIVLVITIIVLIVLAGVAIASLTGNNSITDKAQEAKTKSEEMQLNEETRIGEYETKISESTSKGAEEEKGVEGKLYIASDGAAVYFENGIAHILYRGSEMASYDYSISNVNIEVSGPPMSGLNPTEITSNEDFSVLTGKYHTYTLSDMTFEEYLGS